MADINPDPIVANSYYAAIGRVATAWSNLEADLDEVLMQLAGIEEHSLGLCVTSQFMSTIPRLDAIAALAKARGAAKDQIDRINLFKAENNALRGERNDVIHAQWYHHRNSGKTVRRRIKARGTLKLDHDLVTADYMLSLAKRIAEHTLELQAIAASLRTSLFAQRDAELVPTSDPRPALNRSETTPPKDAEEP